MVASKSLLLTTIALAVHASSAQSSGLKVEVYEGPTECEGDQVVKKGDAVSMHYTGTIDQSSETGEKGKKFDSSRDRGQTFDVTIGTGQVIRGWDEGIVGLCLGAKANLIIPPEMGYGANGAGPDIPGGATLHFDVEVVFIGDSLPEPNLFKDIDTDEDGKISKDEVGVYFKNMGQDEVPQELWEREDSDKDGFISWEEFSGPKGGNPMGDEL
mmetsp:Transcript_25163/g.38414  ORF Transcript_25163/g.38414 Transcript_25163/m.38414 type:complete len:213 (+) Transcript_25163:143-781(+)